MALRTLQFVRSKAQLSGNNTTKIRFKIPFQYCPPSFNKKIPPFQH